MAEYLLTTVDNPWNPFTHFDEWNAWDQAAGHHTLAYAARVLDELSDDYDELSEDERAAAYAAALGEILEHNAGVYRKVESPAGGPTADVLAE